LLPDFTALAGTEDADIKRCRSEPEGLGARPASREDPMFAALRTTQAEPSLRPLVAAFAGVVIAAAILGLLAFGQLTATNSGTVPAAGSAPVMHDHGWSSASSATGSAPVMHDHGWSSASSAASAPSAASGHSRFGGSGGPNGTRVAQ
jgi:hypothetical protein